MCKIGSFLNTKNNLAESKMGKKQKTTGSDYNAPKNIKHLSIALSRQVLTYMKEAIKYLERLERLS